MKIGDWFVVPLFEGMMAIDGGAAFGVIPWTDWSEWMAPDAQNRVDLSLCFFLVQGRGHNLLIDTGFGDKRSPEEMETLGVRKRATTGELLASVGLNADDIDTIILTHLHAAHAGGLTRLNAEGAVEPAFPNARIVVQNGEWERSIHTNIRTRSLYHKEDFEPLLWHRQLDFVDGDEEIFPGIHLRTTGGHTKSHEIVVVESEGEGAIFFGDLLPTVHHLRLNAISAYDLYPLVTMEKKAEWLDIALRRSWMVFFGSDPSIAAAQLSGSVRAAEGVAFEPLLMHPVDEAGIRDS